MHAVICYMEVHAKTIEILTGLLPLMNMQPASLLYFIIFGVPGITVGICALALLSWSDL